MALRIRTIVPSLTALPLLALVAFAPACSSAPADDGAMSTANAETMGGRSIGQPSVWGNGYQHVLVVGTDYGIYYQRNIETGWTGWRRIGGITAGPDAHVFVSAIGKTIHAFVRGSDMHLWHASSVDNGVSWGGWEFIGGNIAPDPIAYSKGFEWKVDSTRFDIVTRTNDGQVWHRSNVGNVWAPSWDLVGTSAAPVSLLALHGRMEVASVSAAGSLVAKHFVDPAYAPPPPPGTSTGFSIGVMTPLPALDITLTWSEWRSGDGGNIDPSQPPVLVGWDYGKYDVFVITSDHVVYQRSFRAPSPDAGWVTGWTPILWDAATTPTILPFSEGMQAVAVRNSDRRVVWRALTGAPTHGPADWTCVGGPVSANVGFGMSNFGPDFIRVGIVGTGMANEIYGGTMDVTHGMILDMFGDKCGSAPPPPPPPPPGCTKTTYDFCCNGTTNVSGTGCDVGTAEKDAATHVWGSCVWTVGRCAPTACTKSTWEFCCSTSGTTTYGVACTQDEARAIGHSVLPYCDSWHDDPCAAGEGS